MIEIPAEFRPERLSRRGEVTAWALAAIAIVGWVLQRRLGLIVHWSYIFLTLLLILSGAAISLTNWVDRRTVLRLELGGLAFSNGLRSVEIAWHRIHKLQELPLNPGKMVRVYAEDGSYFSFRTYGEVILKGKVRGRVGFREGDQILACILEKSNLKPSRHPESNDGVYYVRE